MKITIIGCGTMGTGLAQRLSQTYSLYFYDRRLEKAEYLQSQGCGIACEYLNEALEKSDTIILAVKPHNLEEISQAICSENADHTVISILAGIPISKIKQYFPENRIIRMMPNLALVYGEGLIGLATESPLSQTEKDVFSNLCIPLGKSYWINEDKINAFTSLACSGPAFVLTMIESITDAGIEMGFKAEDSLKLVQEMIKGTLHLLEKSKKHPAELKWQIASPAGTTIAGLIKSEEFSMRNGIVQTFLAAYDRANKLSSI